MDHITGIVTGPCRVTYCCPSWNNVVERTSLFSATNNRLIVCDDNTAPRDVVPTARGCTRGHKESLENYSNEKRQTVSGSSQNNGCVVIGVIESMQIRRTWKKNTTLIYNQPTTSSATVLSAYFRVQLRTNCCWTFLTYTFIRLLVSKSDSSVSVFSRENWFISSSSPDFDRRAPRRNLYPLLSRKNYSSITAVAVNFKVLSYALRYFNGV